MLGATLRHMSFAAVIPLLCDVANAAERIEVGTANDLIARAAAQLSASAQVRPNQLIAPLAVGTIVAPTLSMGPDERLTLKRESVETFGVRHLHFEQTFKGVPIWGERVVVSQSLVTNNVLRMGGAIVTGLSKDVSTTAPAVSAEAALQKAKKSISSIPGKGLAPVRNPRFSNEHARLVVFLHKQTQAAKLSYEVSFFADLDTEKGLPSRPVFLVDANSGEILYRYEGLTTSAGTGPGGNSKMGRHQYGPGQNFPALDITDNGGGRCALSNQIVDTENLNEGTQPIGKPFEFPCFQNMTKQINDGYSPMNDAHYFGSIIYDMWSKWYGTRPISQKLIMRVHYGSGYENAFWNGDAMYFGNGNTTFYPLVALDVTSHEIAHGYTEQHSGLIYDGQSGAINEAFSDMAGEAAEYYSKQTAPPDFLVGPSIFKNPSGALRYMCDPAKDGSSIASAKDYVEGMDVHFSSGVYNKAFCVLAHTSGWDVRKAFQVFQVANRDYWTPSTNFQTGAVAVRDAAKDLSYPVDDVVKAFAAVDITAQ
ncbi:M4 family metallopeptidase [Microbacteriaceae bacterium K1510]|nr:M4 family metallopeptidase [Microbacteriaceae bacterium K1510]